MSRTESANGAACPLCGYLAFDPARAGLLRCKGCGLTVSPDVWSSGANARHQEDWFGETYQTEPSWWEQRFQALKDRRTLRALEAAGVKSGRLLEVGVGSGSFLLAARSFGFEVYGADLSSAICERLARQGVPIHCGDVAGFAPDQPFDVVVMNHVLEHVEDPLAFLRSVRRLVAPGGAVHIAVPNVGCWEALLPGWGSYEPYHVMYFNPTTLTRAVAESGLVVERLGTQESFSGWFVAFVRTVLGARLGQEARRAARAPRQAGKPVSGMARLALAYRVAMVTAGLVSWPLRVFQASLGRGDEVILIARNTALAPGP